MRSRAEDLLERLWAAIDGDSFSPNSALGVELMEFVEEARLREHPIARRFTDTTASAYGRCPLCGYPDCWSGEHYKGAYEIGTACTHCGYDPSKETE